MTPYILLILGLILVFIEFYLPGAIIGTIGGILIFSSMVLITMQSNSIVEIILFFLGALVGTWGLIQFALWRIPRTKGDLSIYSDASQVGYVASGFDEKAIGKKGIVLSDLKPGGYILVDGGKHQALSQSGYLAAGTEVMVLHGEGESLIVKRFKKEEI